MQTINGVLYETNGFYRDLIDKMLASEKERAKRQLELEQQIRLRQEECDRLQAELNLQRKRLFDYANQIPYQNMTPISQTQWRAPFVNMQSNFVRYWSVPDQKASAKPLITSEQQEQIRHAFHAAISTAAHISKSNAPIASLVFDGLGIMTADNLADAAKAAASMAETIYHMTASNAESSNAYKANT